MVVVVVVVVVVVAAFCAVAQFLLGGVAALLADHLVLRFVDMLFPGRHSLSLMS